jgi:hypothetical protein
MSGLFARPRDSLGPDPCILQQPDRQSASFLVVFKAKSIPRRSCDDHDD